MKTLFLIITSFILLEVEGIKNGYPRDSKGCTFECGQDAKHGDDYCDKMCKTTLKGEGGDCDFEYAECWCDNIPDTVVTWKNKEPKCKQI
uniref:Sodium channel toxin To13 n=1 Tax=Tityus obscurus TaxID=1221240 RepID=SCX13_TITOB|nr:RecName: Full=Sodium channel toxin To13; AltName: Full=T NaTx8.1; Flags: Precursor [Tityus obscurus]CCD31430.1 scorpion toxin To13 precursor [Tityus obscurus]